MPLDSHTSTAPAFQQKPISSQIGAWVVADTLKAHLENDPLPPVKAALLRQMALDLAAWLETQS